jgi:type IV fimbrial biogenesis protein FimT
MLDHEKGRFVLSTFPKSAGFTLIEVMVVVAIIALVTMLGLPSYRAWIHNTQIYNAAESVQNGLQKAKAIAVKQNTNIEFVMTTTTPPSWRIQLPGNNLPCPVVPGTTLTTLLECSTSEGAKNVTSSVTGTSTITFNNLGMIGVPSKTPLNTDDTLPLTQIDFDSVDSAKLAGLRKLRVTIGINGIGSNIRMCDRNISSTSTDPRKC